MELKFEMNLFDQFWSFVVGFESIYWNLSVLRFYESNTRGKQHYGTRQNKIFFINDHQ